MKYLTDTVLLDRTASGLAPMSRNSGARDSSGNAMAPSGRARGNAARDIPEGRSSISGAEACSSRGSELDSEIRIECPEANTMLLWLEASSARTLSRAIFQEICRHPAGTCHAPVSAVCKFSGLPTARAILGRPKRTCRISLMGHDRTICYGSRDNCPQGGLRLPSANSRHWWLWTHSPLAAICGVRRSSTRSPNSRISDLPPVGTQEMQAYRWRTDEPT